MRTGFQVTVALLVVVLGTLHAKALSIGEPAESWGDRAEAAQASLRENYWNSRTRIYNIAFPADRGTTTFHYWWQAHAIDVLVDGFERTGNHVYLDQAVEAWKGVRRRNHGVTIDYYDDMEWMALALLRVYSHTGDESLKADVLTLWNDIKTGWNDEQGGGIAWRRSQLDYKNTPANAPAAILAVRLYQAFGDRDDLQWGRKIYSWLDAHLVDPETGFVWDGVNRRGDGRIDRSWTFTYNQGVRIGAAIELYRATDEKQYLADAEKTFGATLARFTSKAGVLRERGGGDKGLFKGILIRYVGELAMLDPPTHPEAAAFIQRQAESMWARVQGDEQPLFPSDWTGAVQKPLDLSVQLSAVMLLEQMARLKLHPSEERGERERPNQLPDH